MVKQFYIFILIIFIFTSCATKRPIKATTATILFKTPLIKFYDKGFIKKYDDFIELNILNAGKSVLYLKIYKNQICKDTIRCLSSKDFNKKYLNSDYSEDFLFKTFSQNKIYFKDKQYNIFIKVIYDK